MTGLPPRILFAAICPLLLVAAACSGGASDRTATLRGDSAGIRVVRIPVLRHLALPVWRTELAFSSEPDDSLGIGADAQAGFTPRSLLLVTGPNEVFRFDSTGHLVGQLGRAGDGPGEFRNPFQLLIGADSTVLIGDRIGRITQLRITGEVVRIIPRLRSPASVELDPISGLAGGRLLVTYWQQRPNRGGHPGLVAGTIERDSAPLMIYDETGNTIGRVGLWRGLERVQVRLEGELSRLPLPFARSALYDGRGAGTVIGPSDSVDFSVYSGTELVLRLISPAEVAPPRAETVSGWERALLEAHPDIGPTYLRAIRSATPVSAVPALAGVVLDDHGNIWMGAYTTAGELNRRWWIFSGQGVPLGQLDLPALTDPLIPGRVELLDVAGDRLALLRITESGESIVEVRVIHRPARG